MNDSKITKQKSILVNQLCWFFTTLNLVVFTGLFAQTNPTPHDLSSGSWTLMGWASNVTAESYPVNGATGLNNSTGVVAGVGNGNMMFWTGSQNPSTPEDPSGDYEGNYSATSASRINGLGADGFSMVMTGTVGQGRPNSAVLALDATGRENIAIQWTAGTVATASATRVHNLILQYRIGDAGTWVNVPGPVEYTSDGKSAGHSQNMGNTILPALCNNQSELFVRWVYYQAVSGSGSRAQLRIDDIEVTSNPLTPPTTCATEDFQNMPANNSSYTSRTWTGTDGFTWNAVGARTDQTLNGRAICFGTSGNRWVTSHTYPDGIGTLSFDFVRGFTGTATRNLQVWVNGTQIGGNISVSNTSNDVQSYSEVLNIPGNVEVQIRSVSGGQVILDDITWTCFIPPCSKPTAHATSVSSAGITTTSATLNWTSGDGSERIVVMRAASDVNANPIDNITYAANATFGLGSQIGTGNFVVYKGNGNTATVDGLTPGAQYFVRIFEFGCAPGSEEYLVSGTPGGTNFMTIPPSPFGFNVVCTNSTTADLTWSAPLGEFDGYVLVARTATGELTSLFSIDPTGASDNLDFSLAQQYGPAPNQGRILYVGNNTAAAVTGLTSNSTYTYRIYTYRKVGSTFVYSSSAFITQLAELNNVTNAQAAAANNGAFVSWTNPNSTCYDEVMVVGSDASVTLVPTGDGSTYTPNSSFAGSNSIIFKSPSLNTVDVTNLVNGDTYFFKIFVRNGTTWSSGVEVSVVPADVTVLDQGDVAIIAVNTQYLDAGGDDEVCFIAFKDIKPGTSIELTDNGYERIHPGLWGNTEGTIRITYQGVTDIVAGTPICLQGAGALASDFQVQVCGVNTPSDWNITSLNGNLFQFNLNATDQVWIFQNGAWNAGIQSPAQHNATYNGNVLWGWTASGWETAPGFASTSGSTLVQGTECFNINTQIPNADKVKYTGPLTAANQSEWVARIGNVANWTGYANNAAYNGVSGRDYSGSCVAFPVNAGGFQAGLWTGAASTDWFSCSNWDDLKVPKSNVDVVIPNTTNQPVIGDGTAECRNITFESAANLTMNDVNSELLVYGNWNNNSGGNLGLSGNNNATVRFLSGGTQVIGGSDETRFQNLIIENGTSVNLNRNTRVGGNGLLQVTGIGSQLGATHNPGSQRTLNIQGNSTMELVAGGTMNDNSFEHLTIVTEGNSSLATFSGNGEEIKCFNFTTIKSNSGGAILLSDTPLNCFNNFRVDYSPGVGEFVDNGNTITVGDDLRLKGSPANFNFTGTLLMTLENSGSGQADIEVESGNDSESIQAELNNLIINSSNDNASVRIQGATGNGIVTIKNNFTIESMGNNQVVNLYSNTLRIGGNYTNNMGADYLNQGNSTVSFFGPGTNQLNCIGAEEFYNLNLNKTGNAIVQLGADIEIENNLSFTSGVLQSGSNTVLVTNDASSSITGGSTNGTNNYVQGRLRRATNNGNYQFPIGESSYGAQGFNINVTGSGNVLGFLENNNTTPLFDRAYCDIETTTAPESEIGQGTSGPDGFLDRMIFDLSSPLQWNVTNPNGGVTQYDITVDANGSNNISPVVAANGTPIRFLLKNGEPGNTGVSTGNVPDEFDETGFLACPNGFTLTGMTSFSTFTINGSTGPSTQLPIELMYFNAVPKNGLVELTWATATELNNDFFTIERTVDGLNWEVVLHTPGAGTTTQQTNYIQFDTRPWSGLSYYRLKQTDLDGEFSYSNIASVVIDTEDKQLIKAVNILGQEVEQNAKGMVILIFSNGESLKIVNE